MTLTESIYTYVCRMYAIYNLIETTLYYRRTCQTSGLRWRTLSPSSAWPPTERETRRTMHRSCTTGSRRAAWTSAHSSERIVNERLCVCMHFSCITFTPFPPPPPPPLSSAMLCLHWETRRMNTTMIWGGMWTSGWLTWGLTGSTREGRGTMTPSESRGLLHCTYTS